MTTELTDLPDVWVALDCTDRYDISPHVSLSEAQCREDCKAMLRDGMVKVHRYVPADKSCDCRWTTNNGAHCQGNISDALPGLEPCAGHLAYGDMRAREAKRTRERSLLAEMEPANPHTALVALAQGAREAGWPEVQIQKLQDAIMEKLGPWGDPCARSADRDSK